MRKQFTEFETKILRALYESFKGNGNDFGFADDARVEGKTVRECQGCLRGLHKKIHFSVDEEFNQVCIDEWNSYGTELATRPPYGCDFETWVKHLPVVKK